jgi:hypothetical protein
LTDDAVDVEPAADLIFANAIFGHCSEVAINRAAKATAR